MASVSLVQPTFAAGEITPLARGRVDLSRYRVALDKARNGVILETGGFQKRSQFSFKAEGKNTTDDSRLIEFDYSQNVQFDIELCDTSLRFYDPDGLVNSGTAPYEIPTPWSIDEVWDVDFKQIGTLMYMVHPDHPEQKLQYLAGTSWTLTQVNSDDYIEPAYLPRNPTETTITISSGTATASAVTGINDDQGFLATDTGRVFRMEDLSSSDWETYRIDSVASTTSVGVTKLKDSGGGTVSGEDTWRMDAFSETTGYATNVDFYDGRRWLMRDERVWATVSDSFEDFSPTNKSLETLDEFSISRLMPTRNPIVWTASAQTLQVGTIGNENQIKAPSISEPLAPGNAKAENQTEYGGERIKPIRVGSGTLYVARGGRRLMDYRYFFQEDTFTSENIVVLYDHYFKKLGKIKQMAITKVPYNIIWIITEEGHLLSISYNRSQELLGFTRHELPNNAAVKTIAALSTSDNSFDRLVAICDITLQGTPYKWVVYLEPFFNPSDEEDKDEMKFLDFGVRTEGSAMTSITGLPYPDGLTVQVVGDGVQQSDQVVNSGEITLEKPADIVHVGMFYHSYIKTLDLDQISERGGTSFGKVGKVSNVDIDVYETLGISIADTPENALDPAKTTEFSKYSGRTGGNAPRLYTGIIDEVLQGTKFIKDKGFVISQPKPYPMTVLGVTPRCHVRDR